MFRWIYQDGPLGLTIFLYALDWTVRILLGLRIIIKRSAVGVTTAWLAIVFFLPLIGALLYLLFGDRRLGARRARRIAQLRQPYAEWLDGLQADFPIPEGTMGPASVTLRRQARGISGIPALPGNKLELITRADTFFERLIADIDAAKSTVHLEFYIWEDEGTAEKVADAVIRAAGRGVKSRILVDDAGSADFLAGAGAVRLRAAGVHIESMLEVGVIRTLFARIDLRNHRKIAVIDGEIGYTGSANIADPQQFKADEGVGQWYDAMVRVTGPAVEALQVTILGDWEIETEEGIANAREVFDVKRCAPTGNAIAQVLPSGPGLSALSIQELLLAAIFGAEQEVLLTSPYFIPDDALIKALLAAAARGVDVTLVVPRHSDSKVVRLAGEAYFEELMEGGVKIKRFTAGMLHTKAISIDGEVAIFGSVNLDMRSFYLNFEISLIAYDVEFAQAVRRLQQQYAARSDALQFESWRGRPMLLRFVQHTCQLLSPLL